MSNNKLQNQDHKTQAELEALGATKADLLNDTKVYITANSLNKRLDQAITDGDIGGSGSGGGDFNFFSANPNAEEDTTGWTVYANTTASSKPDNFGGTPNGGFTWTRSTSSPLVGTASFLLTKPAVNVQGHGVYYEVDAELGLANIKNLFKCLTDLSNFNDKDLSIWIVGSSDNFASNFQYVSASIPEVLVGNQIFKQFQYSTTTTKLRICIHVNTTDTVAKTAKFDQFFYGPSSVTSGAIVTDWEDESSDLTVNNVAFSEKFLKSKRFGDSVKLKGSIELNGAVTGEVQIEVPYSVDVSKLSNDKTLTGMVITNIGQAQAFDRGSNRWYTGTIVYDQTNDRFVFSGPSGIDSTGTWDAIYPFTWASTDEIHFDFEVPIQGWSSNARMSEDLGQRSVLFEAAGNPTQTFSTTSFAYDILTFGTAQVVNDTVAGWDSVNNKYVIKESGYYDISGGYVRTFGATPAIGKLMVVGLFKNGVTDLKNLQERHTNGSDSTYAMNGSITNIYLEKGDELQLYARKEGIEASSRAGDARANYFNIAKRSSPQTLLETETVAARYSTNAGQPIPNSLVTVVEYEDKSYDTHNAYNTATGEYLVVVSGFYSVKATTTFNVPFVSGESHTMYINVNGSNNYARAAFEFDSSSTRYMANSVSTEAYLQKGDVVTISVFQNEGTTNNLVTDTRDNYFSITRIK